MYYQAKDYIGYQHIQSFIPKFEPFNPAIAFFIISASRMATSNGQYDYGHKFNREAMRKTSIFLPMKADGSIDFDFMESFIAELEAERLAELEAERLAELEAYLKVTGLSDCELTEAEEKALEEYKHFEWKEFNVLDIFDVKNTHNILSRDITETNGTTPYLCAGAENNSVDSYINYDPAFLEKGHCIFIGGKTFTVTYQEKDFFSNDSHNLVLYTKNIFANKAKQFCLATCLKSSLASKYSWGNSISNAKIKNDKISLPVKDGKPDYEWMDTFISAIQKKVIKNVVRYADQKIQATKDVITKENAPQYPTLSFACDLAADTVEKA